jgi:hypothetical protein
LAAKKSTTSITAEIAAQKTLTISLEIVKAPKMLQAEKVDWVQESTMQKNKQK